MPGDSSCWGDTRQQGSPGFPFRPGHRGAWGRPGWGTGTAGGIGGLGREGGAGRWGPVAGWGGGAGPLRGPWNLPTGFFLKPMGARGPPNPPARGGDGDSPKIGPKAFSKDSLALRAGPIPRPRVLREAGRGRVWTPSPGGGVGSPLCKKIAVARAGKIFWPGNRSKNQVSSSFLKKNWSKHKPKFIIFPRAKRQIFFFLGSQGGEMQIAYKISLELLGLGMITFPLDRT